VHYTPIGQTAQNFRKFNTSFPFCKCQFSPLRMTPILMSLPFLKMPIFSTQDDGCLAGNLISLTFLNITKMWDTRDDACLP
jgi:hypothetical protein